MSHTNRLPLAPHLAVPTYRNLMLAGLLSRESAAAAIAETDLRAAISPCGRKARLLHPFFRQPQSSRLRSAAAAEIRACLRPLLAKRARWPVLVRAARSAAPSEWTEIELAALVQQQIAAYLRHAIARSPHR